MTVSGPAAALLALGVAAVGAVAGAVATLAVIIWWFASPRANE